MIAWRRRFLSGAAIAVLLPLSAWAELAVALVDGGVEVSGLSSQHLDGRAPEDVVEVSVGADAPTILGSFQQNGNTLRFQPMFPLDPGREYIVRVNIGAEPFVASVSLPARDIVPTTVVTEMYPTTDTLPENQLKIYVHFSAPMAGGDGLEFVKLVDMDGANRGEVVDPFLPLGDAFWDPDFRRYTIFFDPGRVKRGILPNEEMGRPILEGGRYALVIDREWRDADGLPLAAPYRKEFMAGPADETPIEPDTWRVHPPSAGTREPVIVAFGEPLDRAVALRALTLPGVDGQAELTQNETRWEFTPSRAWVAGTYELVALALIEDLAGNQIGKPFEVDVFERIDSPDDVAETHRIEVVVRD